jgi:hypothetical protein
MKINFFIYKLQLTYTQRCACTPKGSFTRPILECKFTLRFLSSGIGMIPEYALECYTGVLCQGPRQADTLKKCNVRTQFKIGEVNEL